jgi:pimeloyl-ACP methyl ester carboxylesterase
MRLVDEAGLDNMVTTRTIGLADGRRLVLHDAGSPDGSTALPIVWHHGSPQTGALLDPLVAAGHVLSLRIVSYARPSYGGSSPHRGRDVASAAADVAQLADALGLDRFAVMGASGGGPHALACAALLPGRVIGVATLASPAPFTEDFDWFAGMVAPGGLRAALNGRDERERFALADEFDRRSFTDADWAALAGTWAALGRDAGRAEGEGSEGLVDDDLAIVAPWGFDPGDIGVPVLLVHGGEDRVVPPSHAEALLRAIPTAEQWLRPRDGHVSVLDACFAAMAWLRNIDR